MLKLVVKVNRAESAHQLAATVPDIQLRSARAHHSHTPHIPHLSSGLISPASLNIKDEAGLGVAAVRRVPRVARLRVPRVPGPTVRGARDQLLAEHRCRAGHVTRDT